jgi:hypothetical protein
MKAVTLRNLPPEVAKAIRKEARKKGTSINKAVINLLEGKAGVRGKKTARKTVYRDLDSLAGAWTAKEAAEFDEALAAQRAIDPDLWK